MLNVEVFIRDGEFLPVTALPGKPRRESAGPRAAACSPLFGGQWGGSVGLLLFLRHAAAQGAEPERPAAGTSPSLGAPPRRSAELEKIKEISPIVFIAS